MTTHGAHRARTQFSINQSLKLALAFLVVVGLLVAVPDAGSAAGSVVITEQAPQVVLLSTTDWSEADGIQTVSNDATSGTFTLWFDGKGPTGDLEFDAPAAGTAAQGTLTMDTQPTDGDTITVDAKVYTFKDTLGAVDGHVKIGLAAADTQVSLVAAFDLSGTAGVDYSAATTKHPTVDIAAFVANAAVLTAQETGTDGNTIATTETFTAVTNLFDAPTLGTTTAGINGVQDELEKFGNLAVSVVKPTAQSWTVTFPKRASPAMTATDSLVGGTATTTIVVDAAGRAAPIDPAGIAYISDYKGTPIDQLLVTDSEINEEPFLFDGINVWEMSRLGALTAYTGVNPDPTPPAGSTEPTGLAYDPVTGHVFFSSDQTKKVSIVDIGPNGHYEYGTGGEDDSKIGEWSTATFEDLDLEDVAFDTSTGHLFLAPGWGDNTKDDTIPGTRPRTVYETTVGGVEVNSFDVSKFDAAGVPVVDVADAAFIIHDVEGIEYRESSDTLLITDAHFERVYELTKDGFLLREIKLPTCPPLATSCVHKPAVVADLVLAPASGAGGGSGTSLYVVDRQKDSGQGHNNPPEMDGLLYELSIPFTDRAPYVDAGPDDAASLPTSGPVTVDVALDGTAFDDGQPVLGDFATTWSDVTVAPPAPVTFDNASLIDATATFTAAGTYELQLEATDGVTPVTDTVSITVTLNQAPSVDAGPNQTLTLPTVDATLDGTVSDVDGLPNPPAAFTIEWTQISGPAGVSFAPDEFAEDPTATFPGAGTYVLRLTADDTELTSFDEMTVTVGSGGGGGGGVPPPPPPPNTFIDDDGNPHEANIEAIAALGITEGCNPPLNNKFCPELNVTRAEMAVFLVQSMGEADTLPTYQGYFSDVAAGAWYTPWVERLFQLGVTVGFPDGSYHPDGTVTHGEMAVFLVNAFDHTDKLIPPTGVFGDVDLAAFYADDAELIKRLGITAGCSTNPLNYCPNNPVRRDHMATFLAKALGL